MSEQRRRGDRGGERDGGALRERSGQALERPADGRRKEQDPRHRRERELPAGGLYDARVDRQRHNRGQEQRVPARADAAGAKRDQPRGAHDTGALQ